MKSVTFLRIDGVNVVGEKLSVYGDFAGGANACDLTDILWETGDSYNGEFSPIDGEGGIEYIPKDGGYYIRVSGTLEGNRLTSAPYVCAGLYSRRSQCGICQGLFEP